MKRRQFGISSVLFALTLTFFYSTPSHAIVDMKNANYADSWLDLTTSGTGYALRIERYYNSRSIFSGMFGFGWCSDFETTIEKTPEGRLKLVECGAGQEVIYSPGKFDEKRLNKLIDELVAFYKKTTPGANDQSAATLHDQLMDSSDLRTRWAKQAGIPIPEVKKGVVYSAENLEVERIVFDGGVYVRTLSDGTSQRFDLNGRLTAMYDKNGNNLKMIYTGDALHEVIDNTGKKLTFTYNQNRRVKDITGPGGVKVEYKFKGEDLVEVHNMWKNKYTFDYDETHNITKIVFPDGTFKALTYNQKNDWVTSFTDRAIKGVTCTESYKYEVDKTNPKDHFWSTAVKKCGTETKNEARFEFWHKTKPDGTKYLHRVLTKNNTDTLDIIYHPDFGRPLSIKKNGMVTTYDYFDNGLIREKSTAGVKMLFEYKNEFNKVSKVNSEYIDAKGKLIRKRETTFTYDAKANLQAAQNSDGQSVRLTYDVRGRIATITDQAKKEVQIKYEEKLGKPATITRPKVGTLNITYKPNGDIAKVESTDGPTVAIQIASTFNNLLDIIAPATSELNL
jgi:YD repeat-containing protein